MERSDRGSPAGAVAAAAAASSGAAAGASTAPAQVDALLVEAARQRDMMEFDHAISLYGQALEVCHLPSICNVHARCAAAQQTARRPSRAIWKQSMRLASSSWKSEMWKMRPKCFA